MSIIDQTSSVAYPTVSAAITGSSSGDVIVLSAGTYSENFADLTHSLTIKSVGGLAHLETPQPIPSNGRAILYAPPNAGINLTISGLEFSGAVDGPSHNNGAGLLFEVGNGNLTIRNSWFHNNQEGVLVGNNPNSVVTIARSEFDDNGIKPGQPGSGMTHNLYVGAVHSLRVTGSYFHDAIGGHEIKSRALNTTITGNRIQGQDGTESYSIDVPKGGDVQIKNNVIEKGVNAQNKFIIEFGGEETGPSYSGSLVASGNLFIGDRSGGTALLLDRHRIPTTVTGNDYHAVGGVPSGYGNTAIGSVSPLNKAHPFGVPEPASAALLSLALAATAVLRRRRRRAAARGG